MSNDPNILARLRHWDSHCKPFPPRYRTIEFERTFSPGEVRRLEDGLIPEAMEDRWFGILRPGFLDFHRSWTGNHIFRLPVTPTADGGLRAGPLLMEDFEDPDHLFATDTAEELAGFVNRLIDSMLRPADPESV